MDHTLGLQEMHSGDALYGWMIYSSLIRNFGGGGGGGGAGRKDSRKSVPVPSSRMMDGSGGSNETSFTGTDVCARVTAHMYHM